MNAERGASLPMAGGDLPKYAAKAPLIHASKLTRRSLGGVGKDLSDGWALNFAIGCLHGCKFCYVDRIHKLSLTTRSKSHPWLAEAISREWGDYFVIPSDLNEAIEATDWKRWAGEEVMMSSTHDPYLAELTPFTRRILELALPAGVNFCIQTRSLLAARDFDLLSRYQSQVRLQVSVATAVHRLGRIIEPRVPRYDRRYQLLARAHKSHIPTGVILAPIFPPVTVRPDVEGDIRRMVGLLGPAKPSYIYGESLHPRGQNMKSVEEALGEPISYPPDFDRSAEEAFTAALREESLDGVWWPESTRYVAVPPRAA